MRFDVITLFPELFGPFLSHGITRRAFETRQVDVRLWQLRDFADGNYRRVDDRPFGGGPGMVMMADPLYRCWQTIRADRNEAQPAPTVLFSPIGQRLSHPVVAGLSGGPGAVLLCGRYEGMDQRFVDACVDVQLSLGDFVLSGGEIAAIAMIDAAVRLLPGALHHGDSSLQDSFQDSLSGLLDSPHYTRPESLEGADPIPPVLLSGNHANIAKWRRQQSLMVTAKHRPDLISRARENGLLSRDDERFLKEISINSSDHAAP